jgi:hypothetical protein
LIGIILLVANLDRANIKESPPLLEYKHEEVHKNYIMSCFEEEELRNFYSSPNMGLFRQIASRRMRWAGQLARMREERKV